MDRKKVDLVVNLGFTIEHNQFIDDFQDFCMDFVLSPRRIVLEVGTYSGCTLATFMLLQNEQGIEDPLAISIDNATYPIVRTVQEYGKHVRGNLSRVGCNLSNMSMIIGDSHDIDTERILSGTLAGRKVDFLFIDADHSYDGVREDYERYSRYMNTNSIIAFHDIYCKDDDHMNIGVKMFWNEIKGNYKHREIVACASSDLYQKDWSGGIGVLYVGEGQG